MEAGIVALGAAGLIAVGVMILTIVKVTGEHISALTATPRIAVTGFMRGPEEPA